MFKLYHPDFGYAEVMAEFFLGGGAKNVRYVGASWGSYRIYANVPASEVLIVKVEVSA